MLSINFCKRCATKAVVIFSDPLSKNCVSFRLRRKNKKINHKTLHIKIILFSYTAKEKKL